MTRDAGRDLDPDLDPDRACAGEWQPVDAPECRLEPKREDEPVRCSSPAATDTPVADPSRDRPEERQAGPTTGAAPRADPAVRAPDTQARDHFEYRDGGAVTPDGEGRHG